VVCSALPSAVCQKAKDSMWRKINFSKSQILYENFLYLMLAYIKKIRHPEELMLK
jgi:hypothetical protein